MGKGAAAVEAAGGYLGVAPTRVFVATAPTYVINGANNNNAQAYYYAFRVKVTSAAGIPTGTVRFMEGTTPLTEDPTPVDADGYAEYGTQGLPYNTDNTVQHPLTPHTITAVYSGDANYTGVTSAPVTFQVVKFPMVVMGTDHPSMNVTAGSGGTANFTVTSLLGYGVIPTSTAPVVLQCNNLPAHATCSFNPPQVTVTEQTPGTAVHTIHTNVPAEVIASRKSHATWAFAAMFGFGFVGLVFGRKTRYSGRVLMTICVLLVLAGGIAGMSACGTGKGPNVNPPAVTPTGTYTVTVTGQHGGNNNLVSLPFTFTLNVN